MAIYSLFLIERTDHPEAPADDTVIYMSAVVIAANADDARAMHPSGDYDDADPEGNFEGNRNWVSNIKDVEVNHLGVADTDSEICVILASTM